jgi:glycosyltransferase involved in cell wall biosynthesis
MPNVTVLIPAHNAAATLAETLDTLVAQTYKDFEVLLVNDASRDATLEVADRYRSRLALRVLDLEQNMGVAGALNYGLARIDSPYIARIDADDLAQPTRLEQQVGFLQAHPNIDVCSSAMELFYEDGSRPNGILAKPADDAAIKTALVQYASMSHGASTFRKSFFDDIGVFDVRLDFAEDYDLWCRGALLGKNYANLPDALTKYRQHPNQVGKQKAQLQYERDLIIKRKYISALLDGTSPGYLAEFFSLVSQFTTKDVTAAVLEQSMPLLMKLSQKVPDQRYFAEIVAGCVGRHIRNSPNS